MVFTVPNVPVEAFGFVLILQNSLEFVLTDSLQKSLSSILDDIPTGRRLIAGVHSCAEGSLMRVMGSVAVQIESGDTPPPRRISEPLVPRQSSRLVLTRVCGH